MPAPHPPPDAASATILLVIAGPVARAEDVRALCEQLTTLIKASAAGTVVCDVHGLPPDARALEALARLQLAARRVDRRIRLRRAPPELLQLLDFAGLAEVIPYEPLTIGQRQRQPEQREDPLDVEEAVDRGDAPV